MHGRKRDEYKAMYCRDIKMVQKLSSKAVAWHTLQTELLHRQNTFHNTKLTVNDDVVVEMKQEKKKNDDYSNVDVSIPIDIATEPPLTFSSSTIAAVPVESSSSAVDTASSVKSSSLSSIITSDFVSSTLELLQKAMTVNPDPIWLWNFRRQLVIYQLKLKLQLKSMDHGNTTTDNTTTTTITSLFDHEHNITQLGLQNNPKAYAVWHYRKWCIQQQIQYMITTTGTGSITNTTKTMIYNNILNNEIQLINLLLQKDERNFHCWSYRRYIISCYLYINSSTSSNHHHTITGEWLLPNHMNNNNKNNNNDTDDNDIESTIKNIIMGAQIATLQKKHQNNNSDTKIDTENITSTNNTTSTSTSTTGTTLFLHNDNNDNNNNFDTTTIIQQEWDFTTNKIHDNFSNFSAFHYRSKLLPLIIMKMKRMIIKQQQQQQGNDPNDTTTNSNINSNSNYDDDDIIFQEMIQKEFELVTNAIYTEPDDQTAWWYQIFLFHTLQQKHKQQMQQNRGYTDNTKSTTTSTSTATMDNSNLYPTSIILKMNEQIVIPHLQQLRELQNETNSKSKWVLIGIVQCLQYLNRTSNGINTTNTNANTHESYKEECCNILQSLIQIDPDRKERYKYQLRQYK